MAIKLDTEQIRNMRKAGLTPEDAIDFPCSPAFTSYYASQGMTRDYPPEYYSAQKSEAAKQEAETLARRLSILEQKNLSGPATKQEVYEIKHLVNKLTERVNYLNKRNSGY